MPASSTSRHKKIARTWEADRGLENMPSPSSLSLTLRWVTVLLTIGAWLVLSNHCALALEEVSASGSEPGGCPMHSTPAKEKKSGNIPCCKDLRALASHALKNVAAVARQLVSLQDYGATVLLKPSLLKVRFLGSDTGPPDFFSFAESILQQSILAHAPPTLLFRR